MEFSEVYIPRSEVLEAMAEKSSRTSSKYFAASPAKTASTLKLAEEGGPLVVDAGVFLVGVVAHRGVWQQLLEQPRQ